MTTHFASEKFIGYTFEPNILKLKKSFLLSLYDIFGTDEIVIQALSGNSIIKLNKGSISSGITLYLHKDKVRDGNMGAGDIVLDDLSNIELDIDFYEDESVIPTIIFAPNTETQVCRKILDMFKLIEVRPKLQDQDQTRVYFKHDTSEPKSYIYMDHVRGYQRPDWRPNFMTYYDDNSLRRNIPYLPFANHGYVQDDAGTLNLKLEDVGIHKLTELFKYISVVGTYIHYDKSYNEYTGPKPSQHLFMGIRYSNVLGEITEMDESLFRPYYSNLPSEYLPTDSIPKSYLNLYELDQDNPNIALTFYHSDQGERVPATDESMRVFVDDQGYSFIAIFRLFTEVGRRYVDYHVRFKMGVIDYPENNGNATSYTIEDVTLLT